jgi:SAM-dependent methyltransferase
MIDLFDDPVLARIYDQEHGSYDADLPFYLRYLRRRGGPVLELGAGTGRVVAALAERGFVVTGVERSPAMLALARERIGALSRTARARATLIERDIRERLPGERAYQAAISAFNSFLHLITPDDQLRTLECVRRALRPRGLLLMELGSPFNEILNPIQDQPRYVYTLPWAGRGSTTSWEIRRVDLVHQLTFILLIYDLIDAEGRLTRRTATVIQRWIFRSELELMLARAGFHLQAVYADYACTKPYASPNDMMLVVAEKR